MLQRNRSRRGFTLIELLVVLVILALLAGLVLPKFLDQTKKGNVAAAKTQIGSFKQAIELYQLDMGSVPTQQQGLDALIHQPSGGSSQSGKWKGPYLNDVQSIPLDPWGTPYDYKSPGPNDTDYEIVCYGEDTKPGGDSWAADISSQDVKK